MAKEKASKTQTPLEEAALVNSAEESYSVLKEYQTTERSKAFLEFWWKDLSMKTSYPELPRGVVSAAEYAAQIYAYGMALGTRILGPEFRQNSESLMVATLAAVYQDTTKVIWGYGSSILCLARMVGLQFKRHEFAAMIAQEGDFAETRGRKALQTKGKLLEDESGLALILYCARLVARHDKISSWAQTSIAGEKTVIPEITTSVHDTLEQLIRQHFPVLFPQDSVDFFAGWLSESTFYRDPASTRYHLCKEGGLALHTLHVVRRILEVISPGQDAKAIATCVVAAVLHDLCKVGCYIPNEYPRTGYSFKDTMPFGHGRKSFYMAQGFFGDIPQDLICAISTHMNDSDESPNIASEWTSWPLGIYLHIADMLASYLDDRTEG